MNKYQNYFLSWFNDFLTIPKFAEYYGMSIKRAEKVLLIGFVAHEQQFGSVIYDVIDHAE